MNGEWIHLYEWFLAVAIPIQCEILIRDSVTAETIDLNQATGICWPIHQFRFCLLIVRRRRMKVKQKTIKLEQWTCLYVHLSLWLKFNYGYWLTCNQNSSISIEPCNVQKQSHPYWPHCIGRQFREHPVQSKVLFSRLLFHQLVEKLA